MGRISTWCTLLVVKSDHRGPDPVLTKWAIEGLIPEFYPDGVSGVV